MIAVDTSALMAIVASEPEAAACKTALQAEDDIVISAATVTEALGVALRRNVFEDMERLIEGLGLRVVSVTPTTANRAAHAYRRWGKGFHAAALNFGDCFAYALAKELDCPLLYIGRDFSQTDVENALQKSA